MATALTPKCIDVLLRAANSSNLPSDIPWWAVKFSLNGAGIDPTTVDEVKATGLVQNIRRVIEGERKDGMREASKEHIGALLVLASGQEIPNDTTWEELKFCLTCSNDRIDIPDSANWLRSFKRFRRTIAGEDVEPQLPQHSQHAPQPSTFESTSDSAYGSRHSDSDLDCVNVVLENCDNYRSGVLSLFYSISEENEKHRILGRASRRCGFPQYQRVVTVTYSTNKTPEPSVVECEVVSDEEEEADIVFSRKLFDAEKKRASLATPKSESGRHHDYSRSVHSSSEYLEDDDKATSTVIGIALQNPVVLNYSEAQITTLGKQAQLATEAARKARRK